MARGVTVDSGGVEYVVGSAGGTIVDSGGRQIVKAGGVASGHDQRRSCRSDERRLDGGSAITFASGGILQLDASQSFSGKIAGFATGDEFDLRDIALGSTTTASFIEAGNTTSGTLTVVVGGQQASLVLLGSDATSQFHLASDHHRGTLITDLPIASGGSFQSPPPHRSRRTVALRSMWCRRSAVACSTCLRHSASIITAHYLLPRASEPLSPA